MLGNVAEIVEDCHHFHYIGAPADGSAWTSGECRARILRGGGWDTPAQLTRSAARALVSAHSLGVTESSGFRLAEDPL
jgi:formylglycine-generating enzyme required for sulfatase activity